MSKYVDKIEALKYAIVGAISEKMTWGKVVREIDKLPTIEVSEENDFKFYYVESIDDYWIGKRSDNFYYAEWRGDYFVWTHSRYLPWGEHIVDENTLWKEHTYPSEPIEISFSEWIVGFMKKHGSKVSEDCISREDLRRSLTRPLENNNADEMYWKGWHDCTVAVETRIADAPSVIPSRAEGEWTNAGILTVHCSNCKSQFHELEAMNYCPNCGAKMKG